MTLLTQLMLLTIDVSAMTEVVLLFWLTMLACGTCRALAAGKCKLFSSIAQVSKMSNQR